MKRSEQTPIALRIVIANPVAGVRHSLQRGDTEPLDPVDAVAGQSLVFDFSIRIAPGPKFFGDQVRREGPTRRFVYIRVGQSAGDHASPWNRRMKIDIHDIDPALLSRAAAGEGTVELTVEGTAKDGSPACATVRPTGYRLA